MNFMLKSPGTQRLKLKFDGLPPSVAINFNLRRFNPYMRRDSSHIPIHSGLSHYRFRDDGVNAVGPTQF